MSKPSRLFPLINNLTGCRFGRLLVKDFSGVRGGHAYWRCVCDCGRKCIHRGSSLRAGRLVSCGCQRADPEIRRAVRLMLPAEQRHEIAALGGKARRKLPS